MLNARLNELTQTANPPFIFAQVSDQEFLISKTKDAFTGIVASKEDGIDSAITAIVREIERVHNLVSPRPNMPAPKRIICVCWNLHTTNAIK
mgnify:CR=1 FL=1